LTLQIFSAERRAERRRALKEEMQRGYFDDFRDFRDKQGKAFEAPDKLTPASHSPPFPRLAVAVAPDGTAAEFPPAAPDDYASYKAALVCVAFRAGAQPMVEAWAAPFAHRFASRAADAALVELALVEPRLMSLWPFRGMLLRSAAAGAVAAGRAIPTLNVFHFGGAGALKAELGVGNKLTAYVYLVDSAGRVRWRGSGSPSEAEMASMLRCAEQLTEEGGKGDGGG
jgi:mitochondrial ATPase complex subunit ATP10